MSKSNASGVRAARLMYIRDLLQQEPRTVAELAHLCGVKRRAIYYDLMTLQIPPLNVPLQADERGRWHIAQFDE
jgi:predicted DNA-binding transcriptional regulator YafY